MKSLIVIVGPTGIGKTDLSIEIAQSFKTEIISSDSRQVYKELRIGTAVPSTADLNKVKHHFIQTISIHDYYNASMFEVEVLAKLKELYQKYDMVLMTGGSGLYIDAVCNGIDDLPTIDPELRKELIQKHENEGLESLRIQLKKLDPDYYNTVDLKNAKRILKALEVTIMTGKPYSSLLTREKRMRDFNIIKIGLKLDRETLYDRINRRVDIMVQEGLVEEAKKNHPFKHLNSLNTVGYKELFQYFDNEHDLNTAIELIKRNSRRYAKRQLSWFNRDKSITWFHPQEKQAILDHIELKITSHG